MRRLAGRLCQAAQDGLDALAYKIVVGGECPIRHSFSVHR